MIRSETYIPPVIARPRVAMHTAPSHTRRAQTAIYLLLACIAVSWFSYQTFFVPQQASFQPYWQDAQWIQAADGNTATSNFRYVTNLTAVPDGAFITIAANQIFHLYVNSTLIGTNLLDTVEGYSPRVYMYDINSALTSGENVFAVRVANLNNQTPALRASVGLIQGQTTSYITTSNRWQATAQASLVSHPVYTLSDPLWTEIGFDASRWQSGEKATPPTATPSLLMNPQIYAQPLSQHWMSVGASHDAYFVRTIVLPSNTAHIWMRLIATGPASVFMNGTLFIVWNAQIPIVEQQTIDYLSSSSPLDPNATNTYRGGLQSGIYDISPYLHAGSNTLAVHVTAPGPLTTQVGLQAQSAALSLDLLVTDTQGHNTWTVPDDVNTSWHAASQPVDGWTQGDAATLTWHVPLTIGRPDVSDSNYLPDSSSTRNTNVFPIVLIILTFLISSAAVLGLWLLLSLVILRRYYPSRRHALTALSVAYLPALACEAVLIVLAQGKLLPQPFPYTWQWGTVLLLLIMIGFLVLGMAARAQQNKPRQRSTSRSSRRAERWPWASPPATLWARLCAWLRLHWGLVLLLLLATPMICYHLTYEPYWQDELTSYYAAKGVLAHGLPFLVSGFLYTKGELYSYLLALTMAIFGEQNGVLRLPSVAAYLISLPLLYSLACYFFNRRVALLATTMLATSPFVLIWGRSVRMYELAQLLTILVMYLFYKAVQEPHRPRLIYLAMLALVVTYLSHEESFIILPALALAVLLISKNPSRRLPAVLYQPHWWIASILGAGVILLQLLSVRMTHPPLLGTDQSQEPFLQIGFDNIAYYFKLLFTPLYLDKTLPMITLNSLLALMGCVWALYRGNRGAKFCAVFLLLSILILMVIFTPTASRYIYPLLPAYYLLGAYFLLTMIEATWKFTQHSLFPPQTAPRTRCTPLPLRLLAKTTAMLVCVCVLALPVLPIAGYNLFISRVIGLPDHRHYTDYDAAGEYVKQHWRAGDIVISISPAISILYYVGHLDYFFSVDRALYLFERNGQIVDTPTGTTPLLSQGDFRSVLSTHTRIWIISDRGFYESSLTQGKRFTFPVGLRIVFAGYGSAVYLRDG